mgnify:CR=1 FL=1
MMAVMSEMGGNGHQGGKQEQTAEVCTRDFK